MHARSRIVTAVAVAVGLLAGHCPAYAAGDLMAGAHANALGQIEIQWQWYEYPPELFPIVDRPDWVGYDLYRRDVAECGTWARVNPEILPRVPGITHGGTYVDAPPAPNVTWEYKLILVDAAHNEIFLVWPQGCEPPCAPHMWESAPTLGAPVTVGTVIDWGWAVAIEPCTDGCWWGMYVENPAADQLRPHAGTGQMFRFYGTEAFGTVEGVALQLDHFEPAGCGPTPVARPSWGRVKSLYR